MARPKGDQKAVADAEDTGTYFDTNPHARDTRVEKQ